MAKRTYSVVLEPNGDRRDPGFGVTFPDLPGCVSFGATGEEALARAEEALSLHLEGMAEDGESFPEPTPVLDLMERMEGQLPPRAVWALVTVEAPDAAERVNVYLQRSLLERIDRHAEREGINRSGFFNVAARRYLEAASESVADKEVDAVYRVLSALSAPGGDLDDRSDFYRGVNNLLAGFSAHHTNIGRQGDIAASVAGSRIVPPKRKLRIED